MKLVLPDNVTIAVRLGVQHVAFEEQVGHCPAQSLDLLGRFREILKALMAKSVLGGKPRQAPETGRRATCSAAYWSRQVAARSRIWRASCRSPAWRETGVPVGALLLPRGVGPRGERMDIRGSSMGTSRMNNKFGDTLVHTLTPQRPPISMTGYANMYVQDVSLRR